MNVSAMPTGVIRNTSTKSRGAALVVALLLLLVITISATVAMRSALFGDMISQNMRSQSLALQAAEAALRFCEQQVSISAPINVLDLNNPNPPINNEWETAENWADSLIVNAVPDAIVNTETPGAPGAVNYRVLPDCIVRRMTFSEAYTELPADALRPEDRGISSDYIFYFRITARGFSPDFRRDAEGNAVSGAQITLQSTLRGIL